MKTTSVCSISCCLSRLIMIACRNSAVSLLVSAENPLRATRQYTVRILHNTEPFEGQHHKIDSHMKTRTAHSTTLTPRASSCVGHSVQSELAVAARVLGCRTRKLSHNALELDNHERIDTSAQWLTGHSAQSGPTRLPLQISVPPAQLEATRQRTNVASLSLARQKPRFALNAPSTHSPPANPE